MRKTLKWKEKTKTDKQKKWTWRRDDLGDKKKKKTNLEKKKQPLVYIFREIWDVMQREHLENKKEFLEFKNRILEIKKELEYNM